MLKAFIKNVPFGISILSLAIALGFIALIVPIEGNKALIVRSGSMQPAIAVGDLVTVRPQTDYREGEIVAFRDPAKSSAIVTHRVVGQEVKNNGIFYQTKGDANEETDFSLVPKENIIGRADYAIRGVGKLLAFTKTKEGFFATVALPALLVILFEIHNIYKEVSRRSTSLRSSSFDEIRTAGLKEVKKFKNKTPRLVLQKTASVLYEHYGKPMGLPHPSASFRSLFSLSSLRGPKGRSNLFIRHSGLTRIDSGVATLPRMTTVSFRALLPILATFLLIGNTFSLFSDTETSVNNIFQAASIFPGAPGSVVINEIMWMGMQGDAADEWIELRNMTDGTIDLSNWVVENLGPGGNDITIPSGKSIEPSGFFLISNDPKETSIINVDPDLENNLSILNPGEVLILKNSSGDTIDTADNDGDDWFAGDNTNQHEKSMERNDTPGDGTVASNWHTATTAINIDPGNDEIATPRAANSAP